MMAPTIEIDEEIYNLLRDAAEPFVDTPNSVLRRLLGLTPGPAQQDAVASAGAANGTTRAASTTDAAIGPRRAAKAKAKKRQRAAPGTLLPEQEYEQSVLTALVEHGGSASSKAVIKRVGELVKDRLTDLDQQQLSSGGLRWQNRIQFVRLRLIDQGLMERSSPRGVWAITEAGRQFAASGEQRGN